jgi:hypothetical protein
LVYLFSGIEFPKFRPMSEIFWGGRGCRRAASTERHSLAFVVEKRRGFDRPSPDDRPLAVFSWLAPSNSNAFRFLF